MQHGESYLDIVWRQFRKNRPAVISMWLLAFIFLIALFAPLIGSNQPFVFYMDGETHFPWFHALFHTHIVVDYLFNMALLAFPFWVVGAIVGNAVAKRRGVPGRVRALVAGAAYLLTTVGLCVIFTFPQLRPDNRYSNQSLSQREFEDPESSHGVWALVPLGPLESDLGAVQKPPLFRKPADQWREANDGFVHLLGTDAAGRDVLVQLVYGARIALTVGLIAVSIYVSIGLVVGAMAGYFGGWFDSLASRVIEVVMLFPSFFLILTLVGLMGPSIYIIMFVIGITNWPVTARLVRGEVLKQRALEYTLSARSLGAGSRRIIFRHILPNSMSPILVAVPFGIAQAIIIEAGLSLLGFGLSPPTPSWGYLLQIANKNYALWWLVLFPSLAIFATVTVLNLVGGGLRDAMDPRLRA